MQIQGVSPVHGFLKSFPPPVFQGPLGSVIPADCFVRFGGAGNAKESSGAENPLIRWQGVMAQGKEALQLENYEGAFRRFDTAYRLLPVEARRQRLDSVNLRSLCDMKMGRFDRALDVLETAIQLLPEEELALEKVSTYQLLGQCYAGLNRFEAAEHQFGLALNHLSRIRGKNRSAQTAAKPVSPKLEAMVMTQTVAIVKDFAKLACADNKVELALALALLETVYGDLLKCPMDKSYPGRKTALVTGILSHQAVIYREIGNLGKALSCIDEALEFAGEPDDETLKPVLEGLTLKLLLLEQLGEMEAAEGVEAQIEALSSRRTDLPMGDGLSGEGPDGLSDDDEPEFPTAYLQPGDD